MLLEVEGMLQKAFTTILCHIRHATSVTSYKTSYSTVYLRIVRFHKNLTSILLVVSKLTDYLQGILQNRYTLV